ncbi:AlbA family DNA-binding domain-containing protein, partial [Anaerosporobacter sp.]|uniref:AlbA family DNA-binding domain-containing protein n=1 Tax=Anaerosporobacter sp. TaxID=1872529 RepID=UPI00286F13D2
MLMEEILAGESKTVEFKESLPEKSIKYMKTVVAFANGNGGRLLFGVKDDTYKVTGISNETVFKTMDAIINAISDSCEPLIVPDISLQEIEGKTIIIVDILPGTQRPYYIQSMGIHNGTFI